MFQSRTSKVLCYYQTINTTIEQTKVHCEDLISFRVLRSRDDSPFPPYLLQVFTKVTLIVNTHEICTLSSCSNSPRKVMPQEHSPLLLVEPHCASDHGKHAHWEIHLLKLYHFQSRLAYEIRWEAEERVPQVVNFASSSRYVSQLVGLHESHRRTIIG